jgi:hypothetical protein
VRRYQARTDANQRAIVDAYRCAGASVAILSSLGHGVPDLLVAHAVGSGRRTFVVEVKDPAKPPSARRLTPDECGWADAWRGEYWLIETVADVLRSLDGPDVAGVTTFPMTDERSNDGRRTKV